MEVVRMVKESSFSDTAIQFFFICILHISYAMKIQEGICCPLQQLANEKGLKLDQSTQKEIFIRMSSP